MMSRGHRGRRWKRGDVGADVPTVGSRVPVGAGRGQAVITAGEVHEPDLVERPGKQVVRGIERRCGADHHVLDEDSPREVRPERTEPLAGAIAEDAVGAFARQVVAVDEAGVRLSAGIDRRAVLNDVLCSMTTSVVPTR